MTAAPALEARPAAEARGDPVQVFGIRHHGPGSARSLVAALEAYRPDAVLIEGPADADPLLSWVTADGMVPPLALLAYAPEEPKVAAFWPYAVFSPEWQAMVWARQRGIEVRFADLPAAMVLAPQTRTLFDDGPDRGPSGPTSTTWRRTCFDELTRHRGLIRAATRWARWPWQPGTTTPSAGGRTWSSRGLDGSSPFPLLTEAMAELRRLSSRAGTTEQRREAYMRQTIRAALKRGHTRVAVVCGAWHAPELTWPLPPANRDTATLRGSARRKVTRDLGAVDPRTAGQCQRLRRGGRPRPAGTTTCGRPRTRPSRAG